MTSHPSLRRRTIAAIRTLWGDGRGLILLAISFGWFLTLGVRIVYPALLPDIMAEFRIDYTGAGFLLSSLWVSYALMQFPGGLLADRFGEGSIVMASMIATIVAILLIMLSPWFGVFALATVLLGVGAGLYGTSRVTILSDLYPDTRTTAVSFSQAIGNTGNAVLPVAAGFIAAAYGWRMGFGYLIPLYVLVLVGIATYVPRRTSDAPERINTVYVHNLVRAVANRSVLSAAMMLFLFMFFYQGATGFLPSYLIEVKGFPNTFAATVFGGFFVTAILSQFLSGIVADRFGERRAIVLWSLVGLPGLILLPIVETTWMVIPMTLLGAATLGAIPPLHTYTVQLLPETLQGSGYGLVRTGYIGLGASAPPIVGYLADIGYFSYVFFLFAFVTVSAVGVCLQLPEVD